MLKIYNSLSKKIQEFIPIKEKQVGMYVCGPTVYGPSHIGHARTWVFFDFVRRYFEVQDFKVKFVQNITDVGHLVGDEEEGMDKIEKTAKEKSKTPEEIARFYEEEYLNSLKALNILKPDVSPRATDHIKEMIDYIKVLIKKGHAYEIKGNVYFDVSSLSSYGKLSGRDTKEALTDTRVKKDSLKKNQADFALWLKKENHLQVWDSPWGEGFPGWHLECSVMSAKYLGQPFDIHGSAIEHIFPHHENEIAQSEGYAGKPLANYFLHSGMLLIDGRKMSKSLGNFLTIEDVLKENDVDTVRLAFMVTHWRKPFDWSKKAIIEASKLKEKLVRAKTSAKSNNSIKEQIYEALDFDFNLPKVLTVLNSNLEGLSEGDFELFKELFGLELEEKKLTKEQEDLIKTRENARKGGNFKEADQIREDLKKQDIIIEDTSSGTRVIKM